MHMVGNFLQWRFWSTGSKSIQLQHGVIRIDSNQTKVAK